MILPSASTNRLQNKFLKGNGLERYGQKQVNFNALAMTPIQRVVTKYVARMQKGVQANIARKNQISSGNAYQTVGGAISTDNNVNSVLVYFTVPNYLKYQDLGVKGKRFTYAASRESPYQYTTKMPPRQVMEKHLIMKYGTPKKELYMASKSLQKKIFNKGIKATKVIQRAITPKLIQQAEMDIAKIAGQSAAIQILEL